jgi:hypothetical protein
LAVCGFVIKCWICRLCRCWRCSLDNNGWPGIAWQSPNFLSMSIIGRYWMCVNMIEMDWLYTHTHIYIYKKRYISQL